jgi:hypothetical protein
MAELDALEGDLALEDAVGASGPSYLQVSAAIRLVCSRVRAYFQGLVRGCCLVGYIWAPHG